MVSLWNWWGQSAEEAGASSLFSLIPFDNVLCHFFSLSSTEGVANKSRRERAAGRNFLAPPCSQTCYEQPCEIYCCTKLSFGRKWKRQLQIPTCCDYGNTVNSDVGSSEWHRRYVKCMEDPHPQKATSFLRQCQLKSSSLWYLLLSYYLISHEYNLYIVILVKHSSTY